MANFQTGGDLVYLPRRRRGSGGGSPGVPGYTGFSGTNLAKWNSGLAARSAGTRNARLSAVGDSTTMGTGADVPHSWPNQLVGMLANSSAQSMIGSHNYNPNSGIDPRVVSAPATAWSTTGSDKSAGGPMLAATLASTLSFTPASPVDTFVLFYPTTAGLGTENVNIDSGSATLVNLNAANALASQSFTTTLGTHTLNVAWASGTAYIEAIVAYNSASKEISIYNMGWASSKVVDWINAAAPWNPLPAVTVFSSDLIIINLMINDAAGLTALATYSSQLQTIITQNKPTSDIILCSGTATDPAQNGGVSLATQQTYVNTIRSLSQSNNLPMIDLFTLMGSYASMTTNGWTYGDGYHLNTSGYAKMANLVVPALAPGFVSA